MHAAAVARTTIEGARHSNNVNARLGLAEDRLRPLKNSAIPIR